MDEILKQLEKITSMGYSPHTVFDDWLDIMLFALMREEEEYLRVVNSYRNTSEKGKREIDYFANAFTLLMKHMEATNDELLGEIYMQWNISNKYAGQYFTPKPVAKLMVMLISPSGSISDPCCGAGIFLVEACKQIENNDEAFFVGQDIDYTCVRMCALNMLFFNLNAYIILGNSLTDEYLRVFRTTRTYLGGIIRELTAEEIQEIKPKISPIMKDSPTSTSKFEEQLYLFGA